MSLREYGSLARRFLKAPRDPSNRYPLTHSGLRKRRSLLERRMQGPAIERRRVAAEKLIEQYNGSLIDPEKGYLVRSTAENALFSAAVEETARVCPVERIKREVSVPSKEDTLLPLRIDLNDPAHAALRRLALDIEVLGPIAEYLGALPILETASVWYCNNGSREKLVGSQLYHFDHEDLRQVKIFIPIWPIDEDAGPTVIVPADSSRKFAASLEANGRKLYLKQRFSDAHVARVVGADQSIALTGRPGDALFVDTSNCLHFGSRPSPKSKHLLMLQYFAPWYVQFYPKMRSESSALSEDQLVIPPTGTYN